jgi:biotin carboxylase
MAVRGRSWFVLVESNTTGSGRYFCTTSRQRGMRPVVLARAPQRYPYLTQDNVAVRVVDTSDTTAVINACHELSSSAPLAGVTSSSDYFIDTAAMVAGSFDLPAPDAAAIARCRNKASQRTVLAAGGVAVPPFHFAAEAVDAARAAAGSVGVRLCQTAAEVRQAASLIISGNMTGQAAGFLVEAHVVGPEFSVETFDLEVVAVVRKRLGPLPHFVEVGHDLGVDDSRLYSTLGDVTRRALVALGLGWGPAHTELRMSSQGPVVIEVNPRLAGGMIPKMIEFAGGPDLIDAVIAEASGQRVQPIEKVRTCGAIRFRTAQCPGTILALRGLRAAQSVPGVRQAAFTVSRGDTIAITHSFRDRLGYVICSGRDAQSVILHADQAVRLLQVEFTEVGGDAAASANDAGPRRAYGKLKHDARVW